MGTRNRESPRTCADALPTHSLTVSYDMPRPVFYADHRGRMRTINSNGTALYEFHHWPTPQKAGVTDLDLIHEWEERAAICVADGGLPEREARRIAWEQVAGRIKGLKKESCRG